MNKRYHNMRLEKRLVLFREAGTLVLLVTLLVNTAHAAIATWNFDSGADNGTAYGGAATYNANIYNHSQLSAQPVLGATPASGGSVTRQAGAGNGSATSLEFKTSGNVSVNGSTFTLTLQASANLGAVSITYDYLASTG